MGKKKASPERIELLKALGRRKYLVKKERLQTITSEEKLELAALREKLPGKGRPADPQVVPVDNEEETSQDDPAITSEGAGDSPPAESSAPPPPPKVTAPPPPPRVEVALKGSWRDRYRQGTGREGACREIASAYCGLLERAARYVESAGSRPIFDAEAIQKTIFPAAVLTADKLLPADFELGPEIELTIYSGTILGQAMMVARRQKRAASPPPLRSVPFTAGRPEPPPPPAAERPQDGTGVRSPEEPPAPPAPPPPGNDYLV
jgi:hypothetical protein